MDKHLFVAFDGDDAGQQVGTAVLQDDVRALHEVSSRIAAASQAVHQWVEQHGGQIISLGGDEGTFVIDSAGQGHLEELRELYHKASGMTVTLGHGETLSQAGKALMAGKLMGKNMSVAYDEHVEQVLADAHSEVEAGGGDEEAQKLDEHYLSHLDQDSQEPQEGMENEEIDGNFESEDEGVEACDCENCQQGVEGGEEGSQESGEEFEDEIQAPESMEDPSSQEGMEALEEGSEEVGAMSEEESAQSPDLDAGVAAPETEEDSIEIPENESMDSQEDPEKLVADAAGQEEPEAFDDQAQESVDDVVAPEDSDQQDQAQEDGMAADSMPAEDLAAEGEQPMEGEQPVEMAPEDQGVGEMDLLSELLAESGSSEDVKARVAEVLQKFKANRELILSMREKAPEMYESIMLMLKNMIDMARHLAPESPPEDAVAPEDVAAAAPEAAPEEEQALPK